MESIPTPAGYHEAPEPPRLTRDDLDTLANGILPMIEEAISAARDKAYDADVWIDKALAKPVENIDSASTLNGSDGRLILQGMRDLSGEVLVKLREMKAEFNALAAGVEIHRSGSAAVASLNPLERARAERAASELRRSQGGAA